MVFAGFYCCFCCYHLGSQLEWGKRTTTKKERDPNGNESVGRELGEFTETERTWAVYEEANGILVWLFAQMISFYSLSHLLSREWNCIQEPSELNGVNRSENNSDSLCRKQLFGYGLSTVFNSALFNCVVDFRFIPPSVWFKCALSDTVTLVSSPSGDPLKTKGEIQIFGRKRSVPAEGCGRSWLLRELGKKGLSIQ